MSDPLLLTVILPLLGAGCLFLATRLRLKIGIERRRLAVYVAALLVAMAALSLVLALGARDDVDTVVLVWRSSLLAESSVRLDVNPWVWPIGLSVSLVTCCLLLAGLGRLHKTSSLVAVVSLGLLGGGLGAIWSANPLTTIISWALYDLLLTLAQLVGGARGGDIARRFALGSLSVFLLWAGVVAAGDGTGGVQWSLMPPGGVKMTLWALAGLLRLGAYPFHFSAVSTVRSPSVLDAALLLSPVMGWALWIRLILTSNALLAEHAWMIGPAVLTLVVGGFLGWAVRSPEEGRSWIGMAVSGAGVLATVVASLLGASQGVGEDVVLSIVTLGATSWMLSVPVLFLGGQVDHRLFWQGEALPGSIPSLLGALSLIGFPPTLGFVTASTLMRRGVSPVGHWGWRVGFFFGYLFLVAAVTRWLFSASRHQQSEAHEEARLGRIAHAVSLIGPVLLLVAAGVAPTVLVAGSSRLSLGFLITGPGLTGWLLFGGALVLGGFVGWQGAHIRSRVSLWLDVLQEIVRLDWAYALFVGAFEQGLTVLRAVDDVLGGRGALLWSFIILLLMILVWRAS